MKNTFTNARNSHHNLLHARLKTRKLVLLILSFLNTLKAKIILKKVRSVVALYAQANTDPSLLPYVNQSRPTLSPWPPRTPYLAAPDAADALGSHFRFNNFAHTRTSDKEN